MRRFARENSLTLVTFGVFLIVFLLGQGLAGERTYNEDRQAHGEPAVDYRTYIRTAHFAEATFENWESEFLQMGSFVLLTVWFRQKGSAESKRLGRSDPVDEDPENHRQDPRAPWPVRRGGVILTLYRNSLSIALFVLFGLSWLLHAISGAREYSNEQAAHGQPGVSTWEFVHRAEFWFQSMQNWQSEFLAVAAIVVLSIFLRQQGSSESKPVHAPTAETGAG